MYCKQGDLAIVIKCKTTQSFVGMVVRVVRPSVSEEKFLSSCGHITTLEKNSTFGWVVESGNDMPWINNYGVCRHFNQRPIADYCLRPVSGLPMDEEVPDQIKEPV